MDLFALALRVAGPSPAIQSRPVSRVVNGSSE